MVFFIGASGDRKKAMNELIRGRQSAKKLKNLLRRRPSSSETRDLVEKIFNSLENSIKMLAGGGGGDGVRSSPGKNGTGCNKRMKSSESWTWSKDISSELVEDGHVSRKYGQKIITNSTHPRSYFRCTHKYDQKFLATKTVQQIQDNLPKYHAAFFCQHTCTDFSSVSDEFIPDTDSSVLFSFNTAAAATNSYPESAFFSSSLSSVNNEEEEDIIMPSNLNQSMMTSDHHLLSSEIASAVVDDMSFDHDGINLFSGFFYYDVFSGRSGFTDFNFEF